MKWIILTMCLGLMGLTPLSTSHETQRKTDDEFINLYGGVQPRSLKVFSSTPSLSELQDGEQVIFSTGSFVRLFFRSNQEIYSVNVSCITTRR